MTGSATQMGLYSNLAPSLVQASDNQSSVSTSPLSFGNLMSHMIGWRTAALEVYTQRRRALSGEGKRAAAFSEKTTNLSTDHHNKYRMYPL